jgi:C4-dicarboxylate-specific signal transduction histidine kinase
MAVAGLYFIILMRVNPYVRTDDDQLHSLAQTEILLLLLAGNVFYDDPLDEVGDARDWALSLTLIGVTVCFFLFFFLMAYRVIMRWFRDRRKEREREEADVEMVARRMASVHASLQAHHDQRILESQESTNDLRRTDSDDGFYK